MAGDIFHYFKASEPEIELTRQIPSFLSNQDILEARIQRLDGGIELWTPGEAPPA